MMYSDFASVYDVLTENVNYEKRAEYILKLFKKHGHIPQNMIDAACGTGSFSVMFAKSGINVIGVDFSEEMLCMAQNKAFSENLSIPFICQSLVNLNTGKKYDSAVCLLDSLNHIISEDDLQTAFLKISESLTDDGIFIFDVNTIYKHSEILKDNTFVIEKENLFCVWQNELVDNDIVEITLDFFTNQNNSYQRKSDFFAERAYSHEHILKMLKNARLSFLSVYDDMHFCAPLENSERVFYVAKKNQGVTCS